MKILKTPGKIVKAGYIPAYWWWPDVANSYEYLDEIACSEESSTIRWEDSEKKTPKKEWAINIERGAQHFYRKHNCYPTTIPNTPEDQIVGLLKNIKHKYKTCTI